jgi:hypothetical protein
MRLNWSLRAPQVSESNGRVGDFARPGWVQKLAYLLDRNIKVALVYGDKDYLCVSPPPPSQTTQWGGGEGEGLARG